MEAGAPDGRAPPGAWVGASKAGLDNTESDRPYCVLYVLLLYCVLIQTIQQPVGRVKSGCDCEDAHTPREDRAGAMVYRDALE